MIVEMLEDICRKIDERDQRVYGYDNVSNGHSKKLLEFCSRRLQCFDDVEYKGRKGTVIYADSELEKGNSITIAHHLGDIHPDASL